MNKALFLILLLFPMLAMGQKKDSCEKNFFKQKKTAKKSSVFSSSKSIKTKYANFWADGRRQMAFSFIKEENGDLILNVVSIYIGEGIKSKIVLGQNIRIALIFSDGSHEIIKFTSSQELDTGGSVDDSSNQIPLTSELLNTLMTKTLVRTEIQNPFNDMNDSKVRTEKANKAQAKRINEVASCFKGVL